MQFISFIRNGNAGFGALRDGAIVDLSARLSCADLGRALREHGADKLRDLASRHAPDFPLEGDGGIDAYRAAVADPQQIFCVGLNYEEHRVEANRARTAHPTIFLRLAGSQTGHRQPLIVPRESTKFDYEGEIAVVIGRGGRRIAPERAFDHLLGFSCYNDGSIRDWQAHTTQWAPGKNFPSTGAFGPTLVTTDIIGENDVLTLATRLNGQTLQQATTDMLTFPIPELVAYVSTFTPLVPGDVIVTGTPGGVGFKREPAIYMKDGDTVEVEVSKVGVLVNPVRSEQG
jgi:2-keto-4-pentenoate hydratase/2-oxohepta-3-ene-1,7-dioic acid hydratase in catechol pathway